MGNNYAEHGEEAVGFSEDSLIEQPAIALFSTLG
jgi:hypothetical protein